MFRESVFKLSEVYSYMLVHLTAVATLSLDTGLFTTLVGRDKYTSEFKLTSVKPNLL